MFPGPKTKQQETQAKIARLRQRLAEIQDYKRLIAGDGQKPDADDKQLESELIVRLLYLEKQLTGPKSPPSATGKSVTDRKGAPGVKKPRRTAR